MNSVVGQHYWSPEQVLSFIVVAGAAFTVIWKLARHIRHAIHENHRKLEALALLIESTDGPITPGALAALHRMERRLLLTAAHVRLAMDADRYAFVETDAEGLVTYVNARWTQWTDLDVAHARGAGWLAGVHPEDRERLRAEWSMAVRDKRVGEFRFRYINMAGKVTPVVAHSAVVSSESGDVVGHVALINEDKA